jgi:hypothetical protein
VLVGGHAGVFACVVRQRVQQVQAHVAKVQGVPEAGADQHGFPVFVPVV